jgi:D-alanyl-D-alanine carboxypeptidase
VLGVLVAVVAVFAGWSLFSGNADGTPTPTDQVRGTTPASSTGTPGATSISPGTPPLPACRYAVLPALDAKLGQWPRTLLDTTFALPDTYVPPDLVQVAGAGFESQELVRSFLLPDLEALRKASEKAGNPVDVLVAYRSFQRQQQLFQEHLRELGRREALRKTARPGHSEHQLGTTVDFRTKGQLDVDEHWESEPAGAWMAANAWKFGFLMSYPRDGQDVTCYSYEPWHYRYFGRSLAASIHGSGLTPRQYLWRLDSRDSPGSGETTAP